VTAVVLAGGRSTRFGADKLAVAHRGRPLLHHALAAAGECCGRVVVVIAADREAGPLTDLDALSLAAGRPVRIARDPAPAEGPLVGAASGLAITATDLALVVGGDMPELVPAVLAELLDHLQTSGRDAAALDDGGGMRPLPSALRTRPARAAAASLIAAGERSVRALLHALQVLSVDRASWSRFDPRARTLRDIDTVADLPDDRG
jgi:molybdenum cofactor guanylyltransferase